MGKVRVRRAVGLFRSIRVVAALALLAPVVAGAGCADVSVNQDGVAPVVLSVEPGKGPSEGGSLVVITGRNFAADVVVRFGGARATEVAWVDRGTLNAVTPPGSGLVSVSVENPNQKVGTLENAFEYDGVSGGCAILSSAPELGAADVPVVGELRLSYSAPINVASLEGAVKLRLLGGEEVPVEVQLDATTSADVIVRPQKSLRFWGSYALTVGEGVLAADGSSCAPAALAFATLEPTASPRPLRAAPVSGLAYVNGMVIAASESYRGLQIYDAVEPAGTQLTGDVTTSFGPRDVVVKSGRAYAPSGYDGVRIFDVGDPASPVDIGHAGTPGRATDVAVLEKDGKTFLIVADTEGGARVLDATNPKAVVQIGALDLGTSPSVSAVDVQGDRVALAVGTRVHLLDLPNPASLSSQIEHAALDVGADVSDMVLDGDRLFVGKSLFGVASYDITDPAAPSLIGVADDPDGPCPGACVHRSARMVKEGQQLFVTYGRGGVMMYDVLPAGGLSIATNFEVPGDVRSVAVTETHVLAGGEEGLIVFDRAGDGSAPVWLYPNGHGRAQAIHVRDGFAYVGAHLSGVQTFSLADPEAPELVDRDDTPASLTADVAAGGVSSHGDVLAVGDGRAGITLFDLATSSDPVLGGTLDTADGVRTVISIGNIVYACNDNAGIVAVDATDYKAPQLLGSVSFTDVTGADSCRDLTPGEGVMYMARIQGIGVLDITDPAALAWKNIAPFSSKDQVTSVRKVGGHLLATTARFDYEGVQNSSARLHVFDLADPLSPSLIWSSEELGRAANIAVVGDKAFVAVNAAGVAVFDISDIESPVLEGKIATPGNASFVAAGPDALYVAQGSGGFQAIRTGPLPQQ